MIDRPLNGPLEAMATTGRGETKDHTHPDIYPLHWTKASKATGVQSPRRPPGHPGQTIQMALGIHDKIGDDERKLV